MSYPLGGVGQNDRQICGTSTASTDSCGSTYMDKHTHGSTSKDFLRSMCTDVSTLNTIVFTEVTGVHGSVILDIYTKGTGVRRFTYMDISTGNMVVRGKMYAYDNYPYGT